MKSVIFLEKIYQITEYLATSAIGENYYPMPKELLQTGKMLEDWTILDVRDLLDERNPIQAYEKKLFEAANLIQITADKIVVCCGAGQSRSNAIALGILTGYYGMDFYEAWELVKDKVPICLIDPSHIRALKKIFKITLP